MTDTITLPRSVVEQALEALYSSMPHNNDMDEDWPSHIAARRALRAALEQPQVEQEPVAWMVTTEMQGGTKDTYPLTGRFQDVKNVCDFGDPVPLYTHPQPKRKPLTDEQIYDCLNQARTGLFLEFARAIERAHGIVGE